ncbi:MAG TPA: hypothetical protein PKY25_01620 [Bacilli bacterium]|nr:hypothetical protein [Bacilli bacterium]
MDEKLKRTVDKTTQALARIERFIEKYGDKLDKESINSISNKIKQLESKINKYK